MVGALWRCAGGQAQLLGLYSAEASRLQLTVEETSIQVMFTNAPLYR